MAWVVDEGRRLGQAPQAGIAYYLLTQDAPDGNFDDLRAQGRMEQKKEVTGNYKRALIDPRVWVLFIIYGCCFGIELTVNNVAAHWGLKGRSFALFMCLLFEGIALMIFSQMHVLYLALPLLIVFSLFTQMAEGATYSVVPFIALSVLAAWFGMNDIASARVSFKEQSVIFTRRHNWIMCVLYTGTFGSFIGYAAGFPLLMKTQFPDVNVLSYAFLGPLVSALSRAATGWISDKFGGGRVTFWTFVGMIVAVWGVLQFLPSEANPAGNFRGFFACFMALFFLTGVGNASTFQMIPSIMRQEVPRLNPQLDGKLGEENNPEWKTVAVDETAGGLVLPNGAIGYRWGEDGEWNFEEKANGAETRLKMSLVLEEDHDDVRGVDFPSFGGAATEQFATDADHPDVLTRNIPVKTVATLEGNALVATVFDLFCANYGLDRGLGGDWVTDSYDNDMPGTPAWAEKITGLSRDKIIHVAREFAQTAETTGGKSMVIIGAAMNHWYHMDMNCRGVINMLVMCGCVGQSGGGWAHYAGQEKLRPQTGWQPLAFGLDWARPPRHMNSTSAWYAHTDQWR